MNPFPLLLLVSLVLSLVFGSLGNSLIDSHDFQHDNHSLQQGSNLLYFSMGSKSHNLEIAQHIASYFKLNHWGCFDVHHHSSISEYVHRTSVVDEVKFVVVHGLECLSASERRSLDFAYRLTDSSIDVSHVVILFVLETLPAETPVSSTQGIDALPAHDTKLKLAESLNEESAFFNGHAFTGRLARTFFESNHVNIDIPAPGCGSAVSNLGDNICTSLKTTAHITQPSSHVALKPSHDYSSLALAVFTVVGIVVILVVLSLLRCFVRSNSGAENKAPVYIPSSVSATVYGSSTASYTNTHSSYPPTPYDSPAVDVYANSFTSHSTPEVSPSQRTSGVTRRSLTRQQAKQLAEHSATSSPTHTATTTTATPATTVTSVTQDRRSTGSSTTTRRTPHKSTTHTHNSNTSPAGEESIFWVGQDSDAHDTRTKKHTRASARF
eukprot:gene13689-15744_t